MVFFSSQNLKRKFDGAQIFLIKINSVKKFKFFIWIYNTKRTDKPRNIQDGLFSALHIRRQ